jgi:hypothetical protein
MSCVASRAEALRNPVLIVPDSTSRLSPVLNAMDEANSSAPSLPSIPPTAPPVEAPGSKKTNTRALFD